MGTILESPSLRCNRMAALRYVDLWANCRRNLRKNLTIPRRSCGPSSPVMEPLGHAVASK